jgi:predicted DNA-binding protein with PD1-like motif
MQSKLVAEADGKRIFVVVLDAGEEAIATLTEWASEENVSGASLTAIGAFEHATVGRYDFSTKGYVKIPVDSQTEVLSAIGDIVRDDDRKPSLHGHVVLGRRDGSTCGGHLLLGRVHPTLEITITETPQRLQRRKNAELGIALISDRSRHITETTIRIDGGRSLLR